MLPSMLELFGAQEANALVGRAARLIGLQFYDDIATLMGTAGTDAPSFAKLVTSLAAAQGEEVEYGTEGTAAFVHQKGWRLMAGVAGNETMFPCVECSLGGNARGA